MSNCTFCGRDEKLVSPGELCPVEGSVLDNAGEKLEPMKVTEFDVQEETGTRVLVKAADPKLPTPEEVDTHNLIHLPYRSWCPHCVRGKGKNMDQRRAGRDKLIPEIHVDSCFMGSKMDVATKCIVVAKDYSNKSVMGGVVPVKGGFKRFPSVKDKCFHQ